MEIENLITLQQEEFEEAIIEYVNKHKSTKYEVATSIILLNGTDEMPVLMTGIKFKAN